MPLHTHFYDFTVSLPAPAIVTPLPPTIHSFLNTSVTIITIAAPEYLPR